MMQRLVGPDRSWRWPAPVVEAYVGFALLCWAAWVLVIAVIIGLMAWFSAVDGSVVVPATGLFFWFLGIFGAYLYHDVFATWIANGRTRFDATIEVGIVLACLLIALTLLGTVTVLSEWLVFRAVGWDTALNDGGVYDERANFHLFTIPLLFAGAAWASAGALVGAAYYRWQANGLVTLIPATVVLAFASNAYGQPVTFGGNMLDWLSVSVVLGALICIVGTGILAALLWSVVRGTPVRRKT